jgi:hypothetical protein
MRSLGLGASLRPLHIVVPGFLRRAHFPFGDESWLAGCRTRRVSIVVGVGLTVAMLEMRKFRFGTN